jgi:hypothetical protein
MAPGETSVTQIPGFALDDELDRLLDSVARARSNRWFEGDVVDADFDGVLAAVTNRAPLDYAAGLDLPTPATANSWAEASVATGVPPRS